MVPAGWPWRRLGVREPALLAGEGLVVGPSSTTSSHRSARLKLTGTSALVRLRVPDASGPVGGLRGRGRRGSERARPPRGPVVDRGPAGSFGEQVSIVSVSQERERQARVRIGPRQLSADPVMAEGARRRGLAHAPGERQPVVAGDQQSEAAVGAGSRAGRRERWCAPGRWRRPGRRGPTTARGCGAGPACRAPCRLRGPQPRPRGRRGRAPRAR